MSTQTFVKELYNANFTDDKPTFKDNGIPGVKYANFALPIEFDGDNRYGYVTLEFTEYGIFDFVEFALMSPNTTIVSFGYNMNSIMTPNIYGTQLAVTTLVENGNDNYPHRYYVIVNGDTAPTDTLYVLVSIGMRDLSYSFNYQEVITVTCIQELYKYTSGFHVYSPYDAIESNAIYKTILASTEPIDNWTYDTRVYQDALFGNPALPFYYGIGNRVIKVGSDFDRAFGTKERYLVVKKRFKRPKSYKQILGPQWWIENGTEEPYSPSCIAPIFSRVGLIQWVTGTEVFSQPQQYRYYMGYHPNNPESAGKDVFTLWDWNTQTAYPLVGSIHALYMLYGNMTGAYDYGGYPLGPIRGLTLGLGSLLGFDNESDAAQVLAWTVLAAGIAGSTIAIVTAIVAIKAYLGAAALGILCANAPFPWGWVAVILVALAALIYLIFALFQRWTKIIDSNCGNFSHYFTTTPYIRNFIGQIPNAPILYRNIGNQNNPTGWLTDGLYSFNQNEFVRRHQTYYVNGVTNLDPLTYSLQYSVVPDTRTLITTWANLMKFIYISGKPEPYCGPGAPIFFNRGKTIELDKEVLQYCDMEKQEPVIITIPEKMFFSCISQETVDTMEMDMLQNMAEQITLTRTQIPYEDSYYGWLDDAQFTHELTVELTPNNVSLVYQASDRLDIGTPLYYDYFGCNRVLDGFYSFSSDSVYRTFLRTKDGRIIEKYYMERPDSTNTTSGQPILTRYRDFTSNWFLYDANNENNLIQIKNEIENIRNFNPNILYTSQTIPSTFNPTVTYTTDLKKGFVKTPGNETEFYLYNDFSNPNVRIANYGYYLPIIDFIDGSVFRFAQYPELYITPLEDCTRSMYNSGVINFNLTKISFGSDVAYASPQEIIMLVNVYGSRGNSLNMTSVIRQGDTQTSLSVRDIGHIVKVSISIVTQNLLTIYNLREFVTCNGVTLCNQSKLWMSKNLDVTKYRNGDEIPLITDLRTFSETQIGARTYPNGDPSLVQTYGYLYNWYAFTDNRGIGPQGFRLPSLEEVQSSFNLSCYQGPTQGVAYFYKESGTTHWFAPNDANNASKFTALPAGKGNMNTYQYEGLNKTGVWWTKNVESSGLVNVFKMEYNSYNVNTLTSEKKNTPLSARLIAN